MHVNTLHKTAILVKLVYTLWRSFTHDVLTALPQLSDSQRFLKATCRLPVDRSCSWG